jgi:hypothetical protein
MGKHYTCDRCGVDIYGPGHEMRREVVIDWPDAQGEKESVVLTFSVHVRPYDPETPDLCDDCYAHILNMVASVIDSDKTPIEAAASR